MPIAPPTRTIAYEIRSNRHDPGVWIVDPLDPKLLIQLCPQNWVGAIQAADLLQG